MIAPERIRQMVDVELSTRGRAGHTALLLCASAMTIGIATLWTTESGLPLRTQLAFALMVGIGGAWTAYAAWVLTTRSVLLARHRILAEAMGVIFSGVFTVFFAVVGYQGRPGDTPYLAATLEAALVGVAVVMLVRARRQFAHLMARREALQQQMGTQRS